MTIALVCGHALSGAHAVADWLNLVWKPDPAGGPQSADLVDLCRRTFAAHQDAEVDVPAFASAAQTELHKAGRASFAWCDPEALTRLDHWKNLRSDLRIVLVYASMATHVDQASKLARDMPFASLGTDWLQFNRSLLRFYYRNRERSILINARGLHTDAGRLLALIGDEPTDTPAPALTEGPLLAAQIAATLELADADIPLTYSELESAADLPLGANEAVPAPDGPALWQLLTRSAHASAQVELLTLQLSNLRQELESGLKLSDALDTQARSLEASLANENSERAKLQAELGDLRRTQEEQSGQLQNARTALEVEKNESMLLLEQLHATQEELESYFFKQEETQRELDQTRNRVAEARAECEQLSQQKHSLEQELEEVKALIDRITQLEHKLDAEEKGREQTSKRLVESETQLRIAEQELEKYFMESHALKGRVAEVEKSLAERTQFDLDHSRAGAIYDMRKPLPRGNWYEPEIDGCWAGPETESVVRVCAQEPGEYELALDIVDAMSPEILDSMELIFEGVRLQRKPLLRPPVRKPFLGGLLGNAETPPPAYPTTVRARFTSRASAPTGEWEFRLRFPKTISPAAHGGDDTRQLAIRLRSLSILPVL